MKKRYMKPNVELVDFSLSSSIAGNCNGITDNTNTSTGSFDDMITLADTCLPSGGTTTPDPDICYHGPGDSLGYFNS